MNTYSKFCPNVFLAKCTEKHEKGDIIPVTTKYGKENDSIVFNLIYEKDGFYYYSIVRADGFNIQARAKAKAEKYSKWAAGAGKKADGYYNASERAIEHIVPGQPILVGHHSEKKHRRALAKSWNAMDKSVEMRRKGEGHMEKAGYWESKTEDINLSMPESVEYFNFKLEQAKETHKFYLDNPDKREHSFSLTYAKKEVNELEKKCQIANKLWA